MRAIRAAFMALACSGVTRAALAQCPDGSPPPCEGARRVAARIAPSPAERARHFLVLPFRNVTRAPEQDWLVEGSPILLADAIGRWQDLSVVSDERLYPAMRRHGLQPGTVMELAKVRRVAEETDSWTAVTGEVLAIAGRVRVSARAYDVVTNRELVHATEETAAGEDVRHAYSRIGSRLIGAAGLDSATLDVEAATTQSLDAYRAYLRGVGHLRRSEARRARDALLEAVRLDSSFAQAYLRLAEASFAISPTDILSLTSPAIRYTERAATQADRLPPRRRDLVRAISDLVHGRFGAARATLTRLVTTDSADVDALEWMAGLEGSDPILVPAPGGGERPRGSINTALRLLKRTLELDPARHQLYTELVVYYGQAAGLSAGRGRGFRREPPSLGAMLMAIPDRMYAYVLRDTFELVPVDSMEAVPPDSLAASRRRALAAADAWARRWCQEAPNEADAHVWMSRIHDLEGSLDSALAEIHRADSLGVETGMEVPAIRRMSLLRRLGRTAEARAIADSLWRAGDYATITPRIRADAAVEVVRLFLMAGDYERADHIVAGLADVFSASAGRDFAETAAIGLLSGGNTQTVLGSVATPALVESLLVVVRRRPPAGRPARWLPPLIGLSTRGTGEGRAQLREPLLAAVRDLAAHGQGTLAYHLMMSADSVTRAAAAADTWFQEADSARKERQRIQGHRFEPLSATVAGDSVVFEWGVAGGDTATWNRAATPMMASEYVWRMTVGNWHVTADVSAGMEAREHQGTLSELLAQTTRSLMDTTASQDLASAIGARMASGGAVRAVASPGRLRFVVRQSRVAEALRRDRPAEARFRFEPCPRTAPAGAPACVDRAVAITYQ